MRCVITINMVWRKNAVAACHRAHWSPGLAPQRFFPAGTEPLHAEEQMMNAPWHAEINFFSHASTPYITSSSVIATKHFINRLEKLYNMNSRTLNQSVTSSSPPPQNPRNFLWAWWIEIQKCISWTEDYHGDEKAKFSQVTSKHYPHSKFPQRKETSPQY